MKGVAVPILLMGGISVYVGVYHLLLFLRRRSSRENLFFALMCFSVGLFDLFGMGLYNASSLEEGVSWQRLQLMTTAPVAVSVLYFIFFIIGKHFNKYIHLLSGLVILLGGALALDSPWTLSSQEAHLHQGKFLNYSVTYYEGVTGPIANLLFGSILLLMTYCFLILLGYYRQFRRKRILSVVLALCVFFLCSISDMLVVMGVYDFFYMLEYSFMGIVLAMSVLLMNRFVDIHNEVESLNTQLEESVGQRTVELSGTLEEMSKLKFKQDGDYFLTSLLIQPLSESSVSSETVEVLSLTNQFKKFDFRKRHYEIGGDLCVSQSIKLKGRFYTAVMNADAMGKSLQGAGGILVLGAVFRSYMERTESRAWTSHASPEYWLSEIFQELQKVFESFDGSMLISLVIGLVDDASGFFYYLNAEHPWSVLLRDGKADFLESELELRKLGTPVFNDQLRIKTFQMEPGDVIILGSDGRDDWLTQEMEDGRPLVNEDHLRFLRCVEEGEGDPERIFAAVLGQGEQMDDTSLLSIFFQGGARENHTARAQALMDALKRGDGDETRLMDQLEEELIQEPRQSRPFKKLIKYYLRARDYHHTAEFAEIYTGYFPDDQAMLFLASYARGRLGQYETAEGLINRLLLRDPENVKGLTHLADLCYKTKRSDQGRQLLERALALEPENGPARRLGEMMNAFV